MNEIDLKYQKLKEYFARYDSVAIAFSSGVDSTLLLYVAHQVLGAAAIAVTATSPSFPKRENDEAREFCNKYKIEQIVIEHNELEIPGFSDNTPDRCYLCKRSLFSDILKLAGEHGISDIFEGSNLDDEGDYRPGMRAIKELGVHSPLRELGLTKADVREISAMLGLPTASKPSFACLASRVPYGDKITCENLSMVERAEDYLHSLGFSQVRVRVHDKLARIELLACDMPQALQKGGEIERALKEIGFIYVSLDLGGYKIGSMNRVLNK